MSATVPTILPREIVLNVNEVFGPTIQGEGPQAGRRAMFLRLAGCNLSCSWCDTPYSWDWKRYDHAAESHATSPAELAARIVEADVPLLVITGGEPMLQQAGIDELLRQIDRRGPRPEIAVETNGTRRPALPGVDLYVVSPKLVNSGDPIGMRLRHDALIRFADLARTGQAVFKFVVAEAVDLAEVEGVCQAFGIVREAVWCLPQGESRDEHVGRLRMLAGPIVDAGFNLSTRIHILAWDTERGV